LTELIEGIVVILYDTQEDSALSAVLIGIGERCKTVAFHPYTSYSTGVAAILIILAYFIVCVHLMMALIEMWASLRAAFLFVGFSGSRWTEPYAERYITLLISTGLRLMILELFVGFGHQFAVQWWTPAAQNAPYDDAGIMLAFQIAVEAMLYGVICWKAPEKIAGILSGSPALSAGSISSFVAPLVQSSIAGVTMIYSSVTGAIAQGARSTAAAATGAMGGSGTTTAKARISRSERQ
jgi:type IV secretion system protein TrbL